MQRVDFVGIANNRSRTTFFVENPSGWGMVLGMETNEITVMEAEAVLGSPVPKFLIGEKWEGGKFVREIVLRDHLASHIAEVAAKKASREASKAAREASDAAYRNRTKLRAFNSREEQV